MMNSFNESGALEDEVKILNERLSMYKLLNTDLSNRIQDLKVQSSSYASELTTVRRELLEEKAKTSEMRRYIKLLNTQCANFFNTFVTNVQQAAENGIDVNITCLGIGENDNENDLTPTKHVLDPSLKFEKTILAIKERLQNRVNPAIDPNSSCNNLLNTIVEESQLPITSTPMVAGKISVENDENSFSKCQGKQQSSRNSSPCVIKQTPHKELSINNRKQSSSTKAYSIFEDANNDKANVLPCFVRLSRCPLSEMKISTMNEQKNDDTDTENSKNLKSESEERDLQPRPKRSKRPRSGTLTEPSVRSKLRRS